MFLNHIYLLPLFPAFGAAIMFFFGRRLQKATVSAVCVGVIVLAFVFACFTVVEYTHFATTARGGLSRKLFIPGWAAAMVI